ncbi:MAG: glycosyl transferase family 3, partial [Pseudomonadota bacterium]
AGLPVLIHGYNGEGTAADRVRENLAAAGIAVAGCPAEAAGLLAGDGIAYLPLEALDPRLMALLALRDVLGLRSPVNTCLRALNPAGAATSVQGVFHPAFRALQREAAARLGQPALAVIKGGGGEFERHPAKAITVEGLSDGRPVTLEAPARLPGAAHRLADIAPGSDLAATLAAARAGHPNAAAVEAVITGTAALALHAAGAAASLPDAEALAARQWHRLAMPGVASLAGVA